MCVCVCVGGGVSQHRDGHFFFGGGVLGKTIPTDTLPDEIIFHSEYIFQHPKIHAKFNRVFEIICGVIFTPRTPVKD